MRQCPGAWHNTWQRCHPHISQHRRQVKSQQVVTHGAHLLWLKTQADATTHEGNHHSSPESAPYPMTKLLGGGAAHKVLILVSTWLSTPANFCCHLGRSEAKSLVSCKKCGAAEHCSRAGPDILNTERATHTGQGCFTRVRGYATCPRPSSLLLCQLASLNPPAYLYPLPYSIAGRM